VQPYVVPRLIMDDKPLAVWWYWRNLEEKVIGTEKGIVVLRGISGNP
jgi:hypothetical protein